jgi:hypothetical protein
MRGQTEVSQVFFLSPQQSEPHFSMTLLQHYQLSLILIAAVAVPLGLGCMSRYVNKVCQDEGAAGSVSGRV